MARAAVVGLVVAATGPGVARAHQSPARRSAIVQIEPAAVAILITWTAPRNPLWSAWVAWGETSPAARRVLRAVATANALAELTVQVCGRRLDATADGTARATSLRPHRAPGGALASGFGTAVLLTAHVGADACDVTVSSPAALRTMWVDRTAGARVARAPRPTRQWEDAGRALTVHVGSAGRPVGLQRQLQ